jgi:hypothetical protein
MELILENFQRFCLPARKWLIVIFLVCSGLDDMIKDIQTPINDDTTIAQIVLQSRHSQCFEH